MINTSLSTKLWLGACLVCGLAGAYTAYRLGGHVETKVVTQVKTNEVVHETTQTKVVYAKDGTRTVDTVKTTDKVVEKDEKKELAKIAPQQKVAKTWHLTGGVNIDSSLGRFYSLGIQRRIFGPVFVGVQADTRQTVGLTLGVEF